MLTDRALKFLEEYEALCRKHGLMVLSDGEEVQLGPFHKDLWNVRESTEHFVSLFPERIKELKERK